MFDILNIIYHALYINSHSLLLLAYNFINLLSRTLTAADHS